MVYNECNLWAGIYKVQTFGTTHRIFKFIISSPGNDHPVAIGHLAARNQSVL